MWTLERLVRALRLHVRRVSWFAVLVGLLVHMGLTWLLLALAGESKLVDPAAFPYYYMTTATTIGYGDLSPQSTAGRMVVAFLLMPGSVALFAAVLAKTSSSLAAFWRRHQVGRMNYDDMKGHTVLVGWNGAEAERLVELLLTDTATDDEGVVIVAVGLQENPAPDHARFVAALNYADAAPYRRAAVATAARVIINPASDDQTLAAVMAVMAQKPTGHVVAHFECSSALELVRTHYPRVECTRPMAAEIIARAAQDPGSSLLTQDLLSTEFGQTQFSLTAQDTSRFDRLAQAFEDAGGMLLGFRVEGQGGMSLNPNGATPVPAGAVLYYLAPQRIDPARIAWTTTFAPAAEPAIA